MPTDVDILILGDLAVRIGGRQLELPGPSVRALLSAVLLTPGDVVGEERLLELAWGPGKGSRRALQCAANRLREWLRRVAGPGFTLGHAGSGYRITVPDGAVDLMRFRRLQRAGTTAGEPEQRLGRLRAALEQWRGPVLGGRPEWLTADPVVRAVEQARVDCAGELADVAIALGKPGDAVAAVREVAGAALYDEPLQARLVRLLSTSGRQAEALRHVDKVRRLLADELGTVPSRDLRNAHAVALRRDDPHGPVPQQLPPDVADFTGRAEPAATITDPVLCGPEQHAPLVFGINGPAGSGTSTFAVHVAHRLAPVFTDGQLYADLREPGGRTRPSTGSCARSGSPATRCPRRPRTGSRSIAPGRRAAGCWCCSTTPPTRTRCGGWCPARPTVPSWSPGAPSWPRWPAPGRSRSVRSLPARRWTCSARSAGVRTSRPMRRTT